MKAGVSLLFLNAEGRGGRDSDQKVGFESWHPHPKTYSFAALLSPTSKKMIYKVPSPSYILQVQPLSDKLICVQLLMA